MGRALIVSAGANSNEYLCARLTELGYTRPLIVPSGAEARRRMLESDFELIVVNPCPMSLATTCAPPRWKRPTQAWYSSSKRRLPSSC